MADSIMRWDPFRDLVSIQDELNRLFGRTFGGAEVTRSGATGSWMRAVDVYETQDKVVATVELPGLDPKEVDVSVEDSTLMITGRREFTQETDEQNYHRIERHYGSFSPAPRPPASAHPPRRRAPLDKGVPPNEAAQREETKTRKTQGKATAVTR